MTFEKLSKKQKEIFRWCHRNDGYKGIVCDGAVRSGKTICMSTSFILWAMAHFDQASFGICGKTVRSAERNIIMPIQSVVDLTAYFKLSYTRATNLLTVEGAGKKNSFYLFGGKDESSYMLIQGITLAGVLFDEVALMPESFVNQAVARTLSVTGAKLWFNCNPDNPNHWFYQNWLIKAEERRFLHLHFLMTDNPILTSEQIADAEAQFPGVFHDRYIRGLWVAAEGAIYPIFADGPKKFELESISDIMMLNIGVDFGGSASGHAFVATAVTRGYRKVVILKSERHGDPKNILDPEQLGEKFVVFAKHIAGKYGRVDNVFCDSAEQTLIAGLRKTAGKNGLGWLRIQNALKT
ncbi:MAG: PBSX family phage terminase large subunit, partial [Bacillota bacterium]